jgi:hypothetical protein
LLEALSIMMTSKATLLALAANIWLAAAQSAVSFTIAASDITFQGYTTSSAGGYRFGLAIPTDASDEFIGILV